MDGTTIGLDICLCGSGRIQQIVRHIVAVLVVEDEPIIRVNLLFDLMAAGYEILEASSADQAIAILNLRSDISHIVTDIDMLGSMDGLRLAHAVRGRWPPVKIIICSGKHSPQAEDLPAGTVFVPKPFLFHHIATAMDSLAQFEPVK